RHTRFSRDWSSDVCSSDLVERLTADLYDRGWAFFQELEAAGGMAAALSSGLLRERVDEVWERRRGAIAHRTDPITGVSEFPEAEIGRAACRESGCTKRGHA